MAVHEAQALWALAAGELDAEQRARVEAHVAGCAECALELEKVKQSRAVLHEARAVTPDVRWGAVDAKLRAEAARRMRAPESRWAWLRAAVAGSWLPWGNGASGGRLPWAVVLAGTCAAMLGFWMLRTPEVAPGATVAVRDGAQVTAQTGMMRDGAQATGQTAHAGDGASGTAQTGTLHDGAQATAQTAHEGGGAPGTAQTETLHDSALATAQAESTSGAMVREAGGSERTLQAGTKLRSGVAVRTPARSSALLRLPDASRVRLSAGSEVELSRAEAREVHLTVRQGRLSVQASHAQRDGFLVEAAGLRVSVVGTVFTVERTEHGAAVAVAEGRVRVEAEGQSPRFVGAGERVELNASEHSLKREPLSEPDQRAFAELNAPAAVAHATPAPAPEKPAVAPKETRPQVASVTPRTGTKAPIQKEQAALPEEGPARTQTVTEPAPAAVALVPPGAEPDQEFAPYPATSVTEQLSPPPNPAPVPPTAVAELPARDKKEPLVPMALMSKDADERFLGYARLQMSPRTCESFLVGLAEIAQRSPRQLHREQARYLRARCFEEKLQPKAAQGEYRQYLKDFPRGRYAREARTGLLP